MSQVFLVLDSLMANNFDVGKTPHLRTLLSDTSEIMEQANNMGIEVSEHQASLISNSGLAWLAASDHTKEQWDFCRSNALTELTTARYRVGDVVNGAFSAEFDSLEEAEAELENSMIEGRLFDEKMKEELGEEFKQEDVIESEDFFFLCVQNIDGEWVEQTQAEGMELYRPHQFDAAIIDAEQE